MKFRLKFSLLTLLVVIALFAICFSMAFRKIAPGKNQLLVQIGKEWKCYDIIGAAYGVHQEGSTHFLTVTCSASNDSLDPDNCFLEFSIPFESHPKEKFRSGSKFDIPVYDPKHGNMNFFYYLGYGDIDNGVFSIRQIDDSGIDGVLIFDGGTVQLRAVFEELGITRSFSFCLSNRWITCVCLTSRYNRNQESAALAACLNKSWALSRIVDTAGSLNLSAVSGLCVDTVNLYVILSRTIS